jgi:hypothetical protein
MTAMNDREFKNNAVALVRGDHAEGSASAYFPTQ